MELLSSMIMILLVGASVVLLLYGIYLLIDPFKKYHRKTKQLIGETYISIQERDAALDELMEICERMRYKCQKIIDGEVNWKD